MLLILSCLLRWASQISGQTHAQVTVVSEVLYIWLQKAQKFHETLLYNTRFLYKVFERADLDKSLETKHDLQKVMGFGLCIFSINAKSSLTA